MIFAECLMWMNVIRIIYRHLMISQLLTYPVLTKPVNSTFNCFFSSSKSLTILITKLLKTLLGRNYHLSFQQYRVWQLMSTTGAKMMIYGFWVRMKVSSFNKTSMFHRFILVDGDSSQSTLLKCFPYICCFMTIFIVGPHIFIFGGLNSNICFRHMYQNSNKSQHVLLPL